MCPCEGSRNALSSFDATLAAAHSLTQIGTAGELFYSRTDASTDYTSYLPTKIAVISSGAPYDVASTDSSPPGGILHNIEFNRYPYYGTNEGAEFRHFPTTPTKIIEIAT